MTDVNHPWDIDSFNFPLTVDSVVLELGGYKGRWCSEIARRYNPRLYVYEPQHWAAAICKQVLTNYNAQVFTYGLGTQDALLAMGEFGTDGCTFMPDAREQGTGEMREWFGELAERGLTHIDLLLINIEGYEYTLLPYIYPMLDEITYVMVQFHMKFDETGVAYTAISQQMAATHTIYFNYGTTLMCWRALDD